MRSKIILSAFSLSTLLFLTICYFRTLNINADVVLHRKYSPQHFSNSDLKHYKNFETANFRFNGKKVFLKSPGIVFDNKKDKLVYSDVGFIQWNPFDGNKYQWGDYDPQDGELQWQISQAQHLHKFIELHQIFKRQSNKIFFCLPPLQKEKQPIAVVVKNTKKENQVIVTKKFIEYVVKNNKKHCFFDETQNQLIYQYSKEHHAPVSVPCIGIKSLHYNGKQISSNNNNIFIINMNKIDPFKTK